ncbi:hypothetical protein EMGBS15_03680 [Filimonas sp.]|nr:hypothetical protein EMGBS15_03680 [Filimonas sp.]
MIFSSRDTGTLLIKLIRLSTKMMEAIHEKSSSLRNLALLYKNCDWSW